ncbi:hypothetical protein [uncultured Massilia sp.]|uniref:hypothetical protein n=1 Tax=uncultured Massilia sp. TaxID=169973 RepID=UPI00258290C7|nr:hypothetical protein [uncultured Massilia sp.]
MPTSLPVSANVASLAFAYIARLFRKAPARKTDGVDLRVLYNMSRGRDSVSPAVLRELAKNAA